MGVAAIQWPIPPFFKQFLAKHNPSLSLTQVCVWDVYSEQISVFITKNLKIFRANASLYLHD